MWDPALRELTEQDRDGVRNNLQLDLADEPPRHRAFGWPEPVQNAMQLECHLASNGIYVGGPEGYRDPRVGDLKAGADDWLLL